MNGEFGSSQNRSACPVCCVPAVFALHVQQIAQAARYGIVWSPRCSLCGNLGSVTLLALPQEAYIATADLTRRR
jgi:hypothetical protein